MDLIKCIQQLRIELSHVDAPSKTFPQKMLLQRSVGERGVGSGCYSWDLYLVCYFHFITVTFVHGAGDLYGIDNVQHGRYNRV